MFRVLLGVRFCARIDGGNFAGDDRPVHDFFAFLVFGAVEQTPDELGALGRGSVGFEVEDFGDRGNAAEQVEKEPAVELGVGRFLGGFLDTRFFPALGDVKVDRLGGIHQRDRALLRGRVG